MRKKLPIGIIDAGLTENQIERLYQRNCLIRQFVPSSQKIQHAIKSREALAVNLGKLWLDKLFPEYELFVFLDADTWVQSWAALELLIGAAAEGGLAIVITWNRYRDSFPVHWYWGLIPVFRSFNLKAASRAALPLSIRKKVSQPVSGSECGRLCSETRCSALGENEILAGQDFKAWKGVHFRRTVNGSGMLH